LHLLLIPEASCADIIVFLHSALCLHHLQVVPLLLMPASSPYLPAALLDLLTVKLAYVDQLTGARGGDIPYSQVKVLVEHAVSMQPAAAAVAGHVSAPLGRMLRVRELLEQQQVSSSSGRSTMWGPEDQQQLEQALVAAEGVDPRAVARQLGQRLVKLLQSAWQLVAADLATDASSGSFERSTKVNVDHIVYRAAQLWRVSAGQVLAGCSVDYTAHVLHYSTTQGASQYHCAAAWGVTADLQLPVAVQQDILNRMAATPFRGSGKWLVNWCEGMLTGNKGEMALPPAIVSQLLELVKAMIVERSKVNKSGPPRRSSGSVSLLLGDVAVAEVLGLAELAASQGAGGSAFDLVMHLLTAVDQQEQDAPPRLVRRSAESAFTCWLAAMGVEAGASVQQGVSASASGADSTASGAATSSAAGAGGASNLSGGHGKVQDAGDPLLPLAWVGTPALAQLLGLVGQQGQLAKVCRVAVGHWRAADGGGAGAVHTSQGQYASRAPGASTPANTRASSSSSSSSSGGCESSIQVLAALIELAAGTGSKAVGESGGNRWSRRNQHQFREQGVGQDTPPVLLQSLAADLFGSMAPTNCLVLLSQLAPHLSLVAAVQLVTATRGKLHSLQPQARALVASMAGTAL
jgi:hypothetical protein